jgi:hypothetical protein
MRSPTAVQRAIDVLGDRCCRLECADLLQESPHDIEATLVTVWMLAGGTDSNPIQDQRRLDRPRTLLVTPVQRSSEEVFLGVSDFCDPGSCHENRPWPLHVSKPGTLPRGQTELRKSSRTSGPRQCHLHQRLQVELGVDQRRGDRLF